MKNLRSIVAIVLVLVLSLTACSGNTPDSNKGEEGSAKTSETGALELTPNGEYPIVKDGGELTLSLFMMSMPNVEDYATNDFTKYMEEKTGIKLEFITAGRDEYEQKMNMLLQSGDYPDMFFGRGPDLAKYGIDEQVIIPLDEYINEDIMPNYCKLMKEYDLNVTRETDGKIYSLADINDCYHCSYARKMWINKAYLDEMGVEVPQTTEEFAEVCKKFLEMKPDGIAVAGAQKGWHTKMQDWLMGSFTFIPSGSYTFKVKDDVVLDTETGKLLSTATTDGYKEGLKYIHSLYEMGAIYDGDFTQTMEQLRAIINQADEPVLCFTMGTISDAINAEENNELYRKYVCMPPLEGPDGTRIAWHIKNSGASANAVCITDKCKNVEAALRWADTFYAPNADLYSQFGAEEGTDWVLNPEGKKGLGGEPAIYEVLNQYSVEPQNHDWQDVGIRVAPAAYRLGQAMPDGIDSYSSEGLEKLLYEASKECQEPYGDTSKYENLLELKVTNEESNEVSTIAVEVENIIEEQSVAFMTGAKDIDAEWDAYLDALDKAGLPKLLEIYQTAYDRQQGK